MRGQLRTTLPPQGLQVVVCPITRCGVLRTPGRAPAMTYHPLITHSCGYPVPGQARRDLFQTVPPTLVRARDTTVTASGTCSSSAVARYRHAPRGTQMSSVTKDPNRLGLMT